MDDDAHQHDPPAANQALHSFLQRIAEQIENESFDPSPGSAWLARGGIPVKPGFAFMAFIDIFRQSHHSVGERIIAASSA